MNETIKSLASNPEWAWELKPNLSKYVLTRGQVAWALANAFLTPHIKWGYMNWERLRNSQHPLAIQRLKCLYDYFERVQKEWTPLQMNESCIEYEHVKQLEFDYAHVKKDQIGKNLNVVIHEERMENISDCSDTAVIDFANSNLHIHQIIPSVTQEELLFSICSECFLGLALFPNEMKDDECIVFRNVWCHVEYTGYDLGFMYVGPAKQTQKLLNIIAIDASQTNQYYQTERDIRKAYLGFNACIHCDAISTGNWGCGAFGGNPTFKFLQQVLAAQWAGKKTLRYSTFGNTTQRVAFVNLWKHLQKIEDLTWEWLFNVLCQYCSTGAASKSFEEYFAAEMLYEELK